jgi:hypothetical protein
VHCRPRRSAAPRRILAETRRTFALESYQTAMSAADTRQPAGRFASSRAKTPKGFSSPESYSSLARVLPGGSSFWREAS